MVLRDQSRPSLKNKYDKVPQKWGAAQGKEKKEEGGRGGGEQIGQLQKKKNPLGLFGSEVIPESKYLLATGEGLRSLLQGNLLWIGYDGYQTRKS